MSEKFPEAKSQLHQFSDFRCFAYRKREIFFIILKSNHLCPDHSRGHQRDTHHKLGIQNLISRTDMKHTPQDLLDNSTENAIWNMRVNFTNLELFKERCSKSQKALFRQKVRSKTLQVILCKYNSIQKSSSNFGSSFSQCFRTL